MLANQVRNPAVSGRIRKTIVKGVLTGRVLFPARTLRYWQPFDNINACASLVVRYRSTMFLPQSIIQVGMCSYRDPLYSVSERMRLLCITS